MPERRGKVRVMENIAKTVQRRARETFEHRPTELLFSINGFVLSSLKIGSERSEQSQSVQLDEKISFVEVFSEQGVRLLFLDVEPPPDRPLVQEAHVSLSDGRQLDLSLNFSNSWPALHAVYLDPLMKADTAERAESGSSEVLVADQSKGAFQELGFLRGQSASWRKVVGSHFWLRPATVTALIAVALIAGFLLFWSSAPTEVSAAELLESSIEAERAIAGKTDAVLHRTVNFEERRVAGDELIAKRRIEIWQSAQRKIKTLRVYDEKGFLISGQWDREGGSQTIYRRGARPQSQSDSGAHPTIGPDNAWQLGLSAEAFRSFITNIERARVEERVDSYVITGGAEATGNVRGLSSAALELRRADLRPVKQTLVVQSGNDARKYTFSEISFEQRPVNAVAPAMFELDAELLGLTANVNETSPKSSETSLSQPPGAASVMATTELEVQVIGFLHQIGADVGQEATVTRTAEGKLLVQAVVNTDQRKQEILHSLAPVANNLAVVIQIETATETQRRISRTPSQSGTEEIVPSQSLTINTAEVIPAHADVRRYLLSRGVPDSRVAEEINALATRTLNRSNQALLRVLALKSLANRLSPDDLRTLSGESRTKWLEMLGAHAESFQRQSATVRQDLEALFNIRAPLVEADSFDITDEAGLSRAATTLAQLVSANDETIRSSFSISSGASSVAVNSPDFWRSLARAESLAAKIDRAVQKLKTVHE
ncbi:MAG TPA: hypothetical protein VJ023_20835 [Pyrinomonadaceae bacterium]|nr:hypothetical protein [Pyrinomonadaceae bacterium]